MPTGRLCVASEMKALVGVCDDVDAVPARATICDSADRRAGALLTRTWRDYEATARRQGRAGAAARGLRGRGAPPADDRRALRRAAVGRARLVAGRGLRRALRPQRVEDDDRERSLVAAPALVRHRPGGIARPGGGARSRPRRSAPCTTASTTPSQEGLDALPDVIRHIETYDVTTIRASTPMYLLARRIKAMGVKMVLSGEGADEIFGGYLYFHKAPNAREPSTRRPCASSTRCTCTTACAPTSR